MKITDLSHLINEDIMVYPGTERPVLQDIDIDGYQEIRITMFTHTATHIDAPYHILKHGRTLDELPIDKFIGPGIVIDCKALAGKEITVDFLKKYENEIADAEFLLLNAGWSLKWKTEAYFDDFPVLSLDAAKWLTNFKLKGIGLDSISLDPVHSIDLPNHHIVLDKEIIIIENLTNLDSLPASGFMFQCLPLKIEHADGSPVRAVAVF